MQRTSTRNSWASWQLTLSRQQLNKRSNVQQIDETIYIDIGLDAVCARRHCVNKGSDIQQVDISITVDVAKQDTSKLNGVDAKVIARTGLSEVP